MSELLTDGELNELLKEKLLASKDADKLVEMQAEVVFAGRTTVTPLLLKEKELFSKLGAKTAASKFSIGWVFTSLSVAAAVIVTSVVFVMNSGGQESKNISKSNIPSKQITKEVEIKRENIAPANTIEKPEIKKIESENIVAATNVSTSALVSAKSTQPKNNVPPATSATIVPAQNLLSTSIPETKTATPSVAPIKIEEAKPVVACVAPAKPVNGKISSCRIWKTTDLCSTPDSLKFPYQLECDACEYSYGCKEINGKKLMPVILRIYKKSGFTLENGFHSITLTKPNGVKYEPFAISVDRYMTNVKKLGVNFKNVVDMILLFPEAAPGDRVSIEGVVEVVIEK